MIQVNSDNICETEECIYSKYTYQRAEISKSGFSNKNNKRIIVTPKSNTYVFKIIKKVPKIGLMLVGLSGNNGSTVAGGIIANREKISQQTKNGIKEANWFGSITQASTIRLGNTSEGEEIYIPFNGIIPMIDPNNIVISGQDINDFNGKKAMERAKVFDYNLQQKLASYMEKIKPLKSIYYPDFIASNQSERANNILDGTRASLKHLETIRFDIRNFKIENKVDKVIVLQTANTERFCNETLGVHDTEENLMNAIAEGHSEVSPSQIFAMAALLEGCSYINGSPQNTFVPAIKQTAERLKLFIAGDDFKSGQTKIKSVLVDFLVSAGIKPESIVSYNHLGNNDGKNLDSPQQFRSKEISKSNVVDDLVESNKILFPTQKSAPDHTVVIKYVPYVADSKRAMDEYTSSIFMNGLNTIVLHNTCEDSLLAAPLIVDLVVLTELFERIEYTILPKHNHINGDASLNMCNGFENGLENGVEHIANERIVLSDLKFSRMNSILSILSYLLKAPQVPSKTPIVNALFRQRLCIENVLRACIGLPPENAMLLEHKCFASSKMM